MTDEGLFIAVEGLDGAGKSTVIQTVANRLEDRGEKVVTTAEPWDADPLTFTYTNPWTRSMEYFSDRLKHEEDVIQPNTEFGYTVLCDRHNLSTLAYQGVDMDHGEYEELVELLNKRTRHPDVLVYIDVPVETSCERGETPYSQTRGESIRAMYHEAFDYDTPVKHKYEIDGTQPLADVVDEVYDIVLTHVEHQEIEERLKSL